MNNLHVVLQPAEIEHLPEHLHPDALCVVFDILRATTSMVTAFEAGAEAIIPCNEVEEARECARRQPGAILAGERDGWPPEGFDWGNSPADFQKASNRRLIMTTTNGTRAVLASSRAGKVVIGAFRNLTAVVEEVQQWPGPVFLVAAGTGPALGLEDVMAAGAVCNALGAAECDDSTRLAHLLWRTASQDLTAALRWSDNGQALIRKGLATDIDWAAQTNTTRLVPVYRDGSISVAITIANCDSVAP